MRLTKILLTTLLLLVSIFAKSKGGNEFTVLQWNVWQEGTMIPGGYDTGLLSKHPITDSLTVFPENGDGSIYRLTSTMSGHKVAVYTAHLDYLDCAYYNACGYDGSTWREIPLPTSVKEF